jgi:hypothetical protein
MSSEIEKLPDLLGYLKCASSPHWLKVEFGNRHSAKQHGGSAQKPSL